MALASRSRARGYVAAFVAAFANASTDCARKYVSASADASKRRMKTESARESDAIAIVAMSEFANVAVLLLAVAVQGKMQALRSVFASRELALTCALSGMLKAACACAVQRAYAIAPVALVAPFLAFTPIFAAIVGWGAFGERVTAGGVAGMVVASAGAWALTRYGSEGRELGRRRGKEFGEFRVLGRRRREKSRDSFDGGSPARARDGTKGGSSSLLAATTSVDETDVADEDGDGWDVEKHSLDGDSSRLHPGSVIALCVAAVLAVIANLDKLGRASARDVLVFMCAQRFFVCLPPLVWVSLRSPSSLKHLKNPRMVIGLVFIGITELIAMAAFLQALNHIVTAYAVAAKRTSIIFAVVGSAVLFNEPIARRLPYVFVMFLGMAMIILADSSREFE